ncbi:MAG TPA: hypothetical protein VD908_09800 [Cytophagales bacterium]|nr:hypothetical protein [Cytophagales bacterium]
MNKENPSSHNARQTSDDEIDLGKVFEKIGDFFLNTLLVFFKNIKTFIIVFVVGMVLTLGLYFLQKPVFISEMTISSRFLTNEFCSVLITNLNKLVEEGNYNQLGHFLKIDRKLVEDIDEIEYQNLNKRYQDIENDTVLLQTPFKVVVKVKDNNVLDTLGGSIAYYIKNNKYARKREKIEIQNIKDQIEMLSLQRRSLDSLKQVVTSALAPRESRAGFVYGEPYEPLNIYKEEANFFSKELQLRKELVESESVEIISDFTKFKEPKRPVSLIKAIFFGVLFSSIIAILIIISKEIGSALKRYEMKKTEETPL